MISHSEYRIIINFVFGDGDSVIINTCAISMSFTVYRQCVIVKNIWLAHRMLNTFECNKFEINALVLRIIKINKLD